MGFVWRETPSSDTGFDGEIELVDGDQATGQIIKVQGKAGRSYFRNEKADSFDLYADANHVEYWEGATNPVILVVCDPEGDAAYWVDVKKYIEGHSTVRKRPHKITFNKQRDRFTAEAADALRRVFGPDFEEAEAAYRAHVIDRFRKLTLYSLTRDQPLSVELEEVFVKLTATARMHRTLRGAFRNVVDYYQPVLVIDPNVPSSEIMDVPPGAEIGFDDESRPVIQFSEDRLDVLSLNDALAKHIRLAVIGAPGAGKTTLLKYFALKFARQEAKKKLELDEDRLPLYVALRDLNRFLDNLDTKGALLALSPLHLPSFLEQHTKETVPSLRLPANFFAQALEQGRCVVLLDGMDEVADPAKRARAAEAVALFVREFPNNRFVVTSRPRGYAQEARQRLSSDTRPVSMHRGWPFHLPYAGAKRTRGDSTMSVQ